MEIKEMLYCICQLKENRLFLKIGMRLGYEIWAVGRGH